MKLGFLTACLPKQPLEQLVRWAGENGFEALELAAWPVRSTRDYQARQIDAARMTPERAEEVRALFAEHGLTISSLAYYDNNLHPDQRKRRTIHEHLRRVIDTAEMLGVGLVGTFIGARGGSPDENIREAAQLFREHVRYAADHGVRLMIENCPMENWVRFGRPGNYFYSPELWDALFNEIPDGLGLNIDPSHLHWLGIDPVRTVKEYASRIYHAHAKDTEILQDGLFRHGILSDQLEPQPWRSGWWRYRLPGHGEIDWQAFADALTSAGYDFVLSIEHEDPEYEGTEEKVKAGLLLGLEHLRTVVPAHQRA